MKMRRKKDYRNEDNPAHLCHQLFLLSSSLTDGLWDAELLIRHGIPWEGVRAFPPQKTPLASPGGVEKVTCDFVLFLVRSKCGELLYKFG